MCPQRGYDWFRRLESYLFYNFYNALESTFSVRDGLSDRGERDPSRDAT